MEKAFKTYCHNQFHQVTAAQHLQYKADGGVALVRTTVAHSIQMGAKKVTDAGCDGYKGTIVEDDCNHAFSVLTNGCDTNTLTGKRVALPITNAFSGLSTALDVILGHLLMANIVYVFTNGWMNGSVRLQDLPQG